MDNRTSYINLIKNPVFRNKMAGVSGKIASNYPKVTDILLRSRQSRLKMESQKSPVVIRWPIFIVRTLVEMIPGGIGPYGIGDAITFYEGLRGQEILDGRKLDLVDRIISFAAALIPVVPATPFREAVRVFRREFEDSTAKTLEDQKIIYADPDFYTVN